MLKLYNTLSRKKEVFGSPSTTLRTNKINLFVCGPTVYDYSHIGHARTYIIFDMMAKYLKQREFDVFYLQNITDLDDKILTRAKETKTSWKILARKFEKEYLKNMKDLKIDSVSKYARATDYIKEIIAQIGRLSKKGFAYKIEDGIYFDISKFKDYGKLSRRTVLRSQDAVSRIDESVQKKNKGDFCLWKFSKPGEPKWSFDSAQDGSTIPDGRPGWHIEDTAITEKHFGPQYDIHGGAIDLIFPHHEAEISQMEAISGKKPVVKYWLHTGFLTVNGQKMSKSLGNFITIKDFLKNHSPRLLRFLIIKSHYRSPIDYSEKEIQQAKRELERIDEFIDKLKRSDLPKLLLKSDFNKQFEAAMEDDFNTPKAMAIIFGLMRRRDSLNPKDALKFLKRADDFFNFIFWPKPKETIPKLVVSLAHRREKLRNEGNWRKADELREKINKLGWQIKDTKEGPLLGRA